MTGDKGIPDGAGLGSGKVHKHSQPVLGREGEAPTALLVEGAT
ncbi:MAG: hypothetical protein A4E65_02428 [Syntrophorhabdus sp. PtaU1.Bin153]|nr:MAG: hypothetical protein A4E65_02428 [Syntrophorhabdus sp. PtaU1.Bin153]